LLAVSCDAAGGVGAKRLDTVRADPRLVGKLTARVALMELLAIGADPLAISGTFSVEPQPTSSLVLEGMREEVKNAHIHGLRLVCSSEKNFKVKQTGIGITALGLVPNSAVKAGRCGHGDEVVAVGKPCVGREVIQAERNRKIADTLDVIRLRKNPAVHELIPVGSKGIRYEANVLAKDSGLFFEALGPQSISLEKSAGPATVLLVAIRKGGFTKVRRIVGRKPVRKIGILRKR
jgi:hypothetical protein